MTLLWAQYDLLKVECSNEHTESPDNDTCRHENTFFDSKNGVSVCTSCGYTVQQPFDESAEWSFNANEQIKKDPSRCGCPSNPLLEKSSMSTMIKSSKYTFMNKLHTQMSMDHVERSLFHVFEQITRIGNDNGNLSSNIIEQAKFYYKIISERKLSRGDIRQGLIACCILYACKYHHVNRSNKEISKICNVNITLLNKTNKIFIDIMYDILQKHDLLKSSINTNDMIPRYCNTLSLNKDDEQNLIKRVYALDKYIKETKSLCGKTPSSITCGMILHICKALGFKIDKKQFVKQHNISLVTVNKIIKDVEQLNM